jgi:hypothetical protein
MTDLADDQHVWPDRLMIRDTKLHDDLGGLGQRIYTTAGAGYVKHEYVRTELVAELLTARTDRLIGLFAQQLKRFLERDDVAFLCDEIRAAIKEPGT